MIEIIIMIINTSFRQIFTCLKCARDHVSHWEYSGKQTADTVLITFFMLLCLSFTIAL